MGLSVTCGRSVVFSRYSSTNKTCHHNITEILLKVELSPINLNQTIVLHFFFGHCVGCSLIYYCKSLGFFWSLLLWPLYCQSFFDLCLMIMITFFGIFIIFFFPQHKKNSKLGFVVHCIYICIKKKN